MTTCDKKESPATGANAPLDDKGVINRTCRTCAYFVRDFKQNWNTDGCCFKRMEIFQSGGLGYLRVENCDEACRCYKPRTDMPNALTLDEAISHCMERADGTPCGAEHAQLADWLVQLKGVKQAAKDMYGFLNCDKPSTPEGCPADCEYYDEVWDDCDLQGKFAERLKALAAEVKDL